jgi:TonB family protein
MFGQRIAHATIAILALIAGAPALADVLHPIQNWVLDYREEQCVAYRDYGTPGKPVTLGIRPAPNGETYELLVARPRSGPDFATEERGSVDFGRGPIRAWLLNYGGKHSKSDIYQFRVSAAEMEQARSATTVTLRPESAPDFTFELRSMPALLKGLQECTADLQRYWNMGDRKPGVIAKPAKGDLRAIFSADDYPAEAIRREQEGSARFLLLISENGSVAGCHVLEPSGVPVFDALGCQVLTKRAKFTPALDASGKPMRSAVTTPKINWRLEGFRNTR